MKTRDICILSLLFVLALSSCRKNDGNDAAAKPSPYSLQIPKYFPGELNTLADNPLTDEGIELGRYLFYDTRLSGRTDPDSMMSCATCHLQSHGFVCGIDNPRFPGGHPLGIRGLYTPHFMLPLVNLAWVNNGFLWNGSVRSGNPLKEQRTLEDITWMVITDMNEMAGDTNRTKALFQGIEGYPELFNKAFGSRTVTVRNMGRAIAQFLRTLVSAGSKFDRFLSGKEQLGDPERRGYVLFMTENGGDCFHCHGGDGNPLFTTNLFYNNGKDTVFTDPFDRYSVTGNSMDIGAYVAPTLRNAAFRAPYMHDGRFKTLDEVIEFYSSKVVWSPSISPLMHHVATHGVRLTASQKADLKAFLLTLSDSSFINNPAFACPASFPGQ